MLFLLVVLVFAKKHRCKVTKGLRKGVSGVFHVFSSRLQDKKSVKTALFFGGFKEINKHLTQLSGVIKTTDEADYTDF